MRDPVVRAIFDIRVADAQAVFATDIHFFRYDAGIKIDVLVDSFSMCHGLSFRGRIGIDALTLPLAQIASWASGIPACSRSPRRADGWRPRGKMIPSGKRLTCA
jgi:hypothetical protein